MKKLLLSILLLSGVVITSNATDVKFVSLGKGPNTRVRAKQRAQTLKIFKEADATQLWKPATIENYYWDAWSTETPHWELASTVAYEYNSAGQITKMKYTDGAEATLSYDSSGRLIAREESNTSGVYATYQYKYDTVVPDLVVEQTTYMAENGQLILNHGERTSITRNDAGVITRIETESYQKYSDNPAWVKENDVVMTIGADGNINGYTYTYYDDDDTEVEAQFTDIVWEQTDGQMVYYEYDEPEFYLGANRIKSATGVAKNTYPYVADIALTAEYKADNGGYKSNAVMNATPYRWQDYTTIDAATNSYTLLDYEVDYDHDSTTDTYVADDPMLYQTTMQYDTYGLLTLNHEIEYTDADQSKGIDFESKTVGTVTYDPTYGYPTEYTSENHYDGKVNPNSHQVFKDYYDVKAAGINTIQTPDAPVEYYNLQGVRIDNPGQGLYIRRQGATASKVIL